VERFARLRRFSRGEAYDEQPIPELRALQFHVDSLRV